MRYFLDTEFVEHPDQHKIELISIGMVAEDGRTFYAINLDFDGAGAGEWIEANVLSKLPSRPSGEGNRGRANDHWRTPENIRNGIIEFIGEDKPEFWGYYSDYDWVVFCWLFGKMIDLPEKYPAYCRDIKQLMDWLGIEKIPFDPEDEHTALSDAEWNRKAFNWLEKNVGRMKHRKPKQMNPGAKI